MNEELDNAFESELDVEAAPVAADADVSGPEPEDAPSNHIGEEGDDGSPEPSSDGSSAEPIPTSFGTVTGRLSEIADTLQDADMPLDDALDLLEEAVALGMKASTLLEEDMAARDAAEDAAAEGADVALASDGQDDAADAAAPVPAGSHPAENRW